MSDPHAFSATPAGHNKPPRESLLKAMDAVTKAEKLLSEIPLAKSKDDAEKIAKGIRDTQAAAEALEIDRVTRVNPLNARIKAVNDEYRSPQLAFEMVIAKLKSVARMFLLAEDERRKADAERLRKEAEAKAEAARIAQEEARREAERAQDGDITEGPLRDAEAAREAQEATLEARKAEARAAAVEKASVAVGGGEAGRAVGLRWKETVSIAGKGDAIKVVTNIGMEDAKLIDELIKAARRFQKKYNRWPIGITITKERV